MKKYLKILNMIDIPWFSGLSDYALAQSDVLKNSGHDVFFLAPYKSRIYDTATQKGYKVIEISDRKKILNPVEIYKIIKFVKNEKIDILNANTGRMQTLAYIISLFVKNIKIIRTKADARDIKKSFTYSKVSLIITGSRYIENMYKNKNINTKTLNIYKSIPLNSPPPFNKNLPFKIGIVARLDPVKGHKWFIKSALEILSKGFNTVFLISGIESKIKWKDLLSDIPKKFKSKFEYRGFSKDINEFMQECHIGVISSTASEAVSRVALEWMSNARALISTDVGSLKEFVDNNFLVKPYNYKDMADKIIQILDFSKIEMIGMKNFNRIKSDFSYDRFKDETANAFESLFKLTS